MFINQPKDNDSQTSESPYGLNGFWSPCTLVNSYLSQLVPTLVN